MKGIIASYCNFLYLQCHRDTEKSEGMFGTLVVQLPSNYSGGQLVVYHQSKSKEFDFGGPLGCSNIHYAAFYADCKHEIKPVTSGYRLCLIYNLVYKGPGDCPVPAYNQEIVSAVASSMRRWGEDVKEGLPMLAYMLEHQYCEASLSFKWLKNSDRAVADILSQSKREEEFDVYLGTVKVTDNWESNSDYRMDCSDFLVDRDIRAKNLKSQDGHTIYHNVRLVSNYIRPEEFFEFVDPTKEDFKEYTGNEGAEVEKQYHWGALLFWPRKNRVKNLGFNNVVAMLNNDLQHLPISRNKRTELVVLAKDLIRDYDESSRYVIKGCCNTCDFRVLCLQAFRKLGEVDLIVDYFSVLIINPVQLEPTDEIAAVGYQFGWEVLKSLLLSLFEKLLPTSLSDCSLFLSKFSQQPISEGQKDLCLSLANESLRAFCGNNCDETFCNKADAFPLLLESLRNLGDLELLSKFLSDVASSPPILNKVIVNDSFTKGILLVGQNFEWDILKQPLQAMFSNLFSSSDMIGKYIEFLSEISQQPSQVLRDICYGLAGTIVNVFSNLNDSVQNSIEGSDLLTFFKCLVVLQCDQQLFNNLIQVVMSKPNCFPIVETLVPVCIGLDSLEVGDRGSESIKSLLSHVISYLETYCSKPAPHFKDWSQVVSFSCSCKACLDLMKFLRDPVKQDDYFSKDIEHLQRQLKDNKCFVTIKTITVMRDATIKVTKTREAYQQECKRYEKAKTILPRLQALISDVERPAKQQKMDD